MVTREADPTDVAVLRDPDAAAVLLDPARRRLVVALAAEPASAAGLARRLGDSRQRLNYHLRTLEEAGVVEVESERPRGNFVERVLRPVAPRFVVDPGVLGELGAEPPAGGDRLSATYLIAVAARAIRELADLRERASSSGKRLATATVETEVRLESPAAFEAFVHDLSRAVARVVAKHHDHASGSRPYRVVAGAYPSAGARTAEPEQRGDEA